MLGCSPFSSKQVFHLAHTKIIHEQARASSLLEAPLHGSAQVRCFLSNFNLRVFVRSYVSAGTSAGRLWGARE
jgi:hypothetical protein